MARKVTKNGNKRNRQDKSSAPRTGNVHSTNDPNWYAADPSILRDAASIPFSWALGTSIDMGGQGTFTDKGRHALPGICAITLRPNLGLSVDSVSAANVAATSMYTYVRSANSGHANYDSPDLMMYATAMAQVYSFINYCQRLYGLATVYVQKNRYLPKAIISAQGVDADSVINNLANFRYWINVMIAKASSLAVPATMSYFSRTAFLYQNVYCEGDSIKDQLYLFQPDGFYQFQFPEETLPGALIYTPLTSQFTTGLTIAELQEYGDEMLNRILGDEDMNIMSGDILKAYGIEGIIKLAPLDEWYPIVPIYDEMVLEQFHNAVIVDVAASDITQPGGKYLSCVPAVDINDGAKVYALTSNKILTSHVDEPSPEIVVESTRLMISGDVSRSTGDLLYVGAGTELPVKVSYFKITGDGALNANRNSGPLVLNSTTPTAAQIQSLVNIIGDASKFKYAPNIIILDSVSSGLWDNVMGVDNYAVLSPQDVYKMHDVALMNMLAVPSIAKVNRV